MDIIDTVALRTSHPDVNGVFVSVGEGGTNDVMEPAYLSNLAMGIYTIRFSPMNRESNWSLDRAGHGESIGYKDVFIVGLVDGWVTLGIIVTYALVLLPSKNIVNHMTPYVRIGLPVGREPLAKHGHERRGVLRDMPKARFMYTMKSGDNLLTKAVVSVSGIVEVADKSEISCLVSFRVRVKYATTNTNLAIVDVMASCMFTLTELYLNNTIGTALTTHMILCLKMCKRLIKTCVMCNGMIASLVARMEYDPNRYPNTPINVWLHNHARTNRNNVRNSLKFMFCDTCKTNTGTTQPQCDIHY
ncbi:hypothetical protein AYL99_11881 [Fonsecaea erecta]|uniref:Uncharacterized protein n=1 Tax=Fonsecaea erecta TaxID=1367422 RepID=A0A178Z246_9EURO|nr:hypothetical protein AYL99_11881 [Fonsecaea erecta]OAP53859.1 hypothetical protein AYL99_11881 [Fonsecaea erecta]